MKKKILLPIILTAFIISGCNKTDTSVSSAQPSSQDIPGSQQPSSAAPSSEASRASSQAPSSAPASSSSAKSSSAASSSSAKSSSAPSSSSAKPSSSSQAPSSSSAQPSSSTTPSSSQAPQYLKKDITVQLDSFFKTPEEGQTLEPYDMAFVYDDEYFLNDANVYDKGLSMLSLGATMSLAAEDRGDKFYSDIAFKDVYKNDFDKEPTKDTIGYFMAHKVIGDNEVVAVSLRGYNYGLEWSNNLLFGEEGNHYGFDLRAQDVFTKLQSYITEKTDRNKTLKLWINGYSRGGSIANVLASHILSSDEFIIDPANMYVYTYEAPRCLSEENAIRYENVHNIINKADLIANVIPEQYELYRCGIDYEIYAPNASTLMKAFDEEIEMPEFALPENSDVPATNDEEFCNYVLGTVYNCTTTDDETKLATTRKQYFDNYQEGLSGAVSYLFALSTETRNQALADLQAMGFMAIVVISDDTGVALANFLKTYLDQDHVPYVEEQLVSECAVLSKACMSVFASLLLLFISPDDYKTPIMREVSFHYPETIYVLLDNAHNSEVAVVIG